MTPKAERKYPQRWLQFQSAKLYHACAEMCEINLPVYFVIEKAIRDALGLQPGYIAVQRLVENHVEVYFYLPEHQESLRGILADMVEKTIPPEKWSEACEEAWSKTIASEWIVSEADE